MGYRHVIATFLVALIGLGCDLGSDGSQAAMDEDISTSTSMADIGIPIPEYVPPVAVIYEPEDGQIFVHGEPIELVGKVGISLDDDMGGGAHWVSDLEGVVWDGVGSASGLVTWTWEDASPGLHAITLLSIDSKNEVATTTVNILVNDIPSPPEIVIEPASPNTADDLEVSLEVLAQDANKSDVLTYEYRWYRSGQLVPDLDGNTVPNAMTQRGETWKVMVSVSDGYHASDEVVAETAILNAAPSYEGAAIIPDSGGVTTTFTCAGKWWSDPDGDLETAQYLWEINGDEIVSDNGPSLTLGLAKKGDWIRCGVTPFDGFVFGETLYSDELTVGNTAPSLESTDIFPKNGDVTTTFSCSHGLAIDPDLQDEASVETRWLLDGVVLEGVTGKEFIPHTVGAKGGQTLGCQGVPDDGFDMGVIVHSQVLILDNAVPEVGAVTVSVEGQVAEQGMIATELESLSCHVASVTDPDQESLDIVYKWLSGDDWIVGMDGEVYESMTLNGMYFNKGEFIRCFATVNDANGAEVQKGSANSIQIVNSPPSLETAILTPEEPSKNTELTCSPEGWFDVDPADQPFDETGTDPMDTVPPALLVSWYAAGEMIPGAEGTTFTPMAYGAGTEIQCKVTPFDGQDHGLSVWSEAVVLVNHTPSIESVLLQPTPAYGNTTLECVPIGWEDADGDDPDYLYAWKVNGEVLGIAQGAHLPPPWFVKGDTVECLITPWDGSLMGIQVSSAVIEIQNQPPALSGIKLTPEVGGKKSTFMCQVNEVFDSDPEDVVTFQFSWHLEDGTVIENQEDSALSGAVPPMNTGFYCEVIPYDGTEYGSVYTSGQAMVVNAAPSLDNALLVPAEPTTLSQLECIPEGFKDPDGDEPVFVFKWFRNNVEIPYEDEGVLNPGIVKNGDVVFCQVTPGDGIVNGLPVISNAITVLNAAPSAPVIEISPATPLLGDELSCDVVTPGVDADEDALTYETFWLLNGNWKLEGPTVGSEWTDGCGTWTCGVVALDGLGGESAPAIAQVDLHDGTAVDLSGNAGILILDVVAEDLPLASKPMTVEFWVKSETNLQGVLFEAASGNESGDVTMEKGVRVFSDVEGHLTMELWDGELGLITAFDEDMVLPSSNSFVHVAATYDGSTARVWLDGQLAAEGVGAMSESFGYGDFDGVWVFGGHYSGTGGSGLDVGGWSGAIDHIRVSKTNRYPNEYVPPAGFVMDSKTLALFAMDEGSGDVVVDTAVGMIGYLTLGNDGVSEFVPGFCSYLSETPSEPVVTILPIEPTTENTLVCQGVSSDPEGDPMVYTYSWLKDGVLQPGLDSAVVSSSLTKSCETWTCQVVASDGASQSPVGSGMATVENAWDEQTVFGFDMASEQSWYEGFAEGEMFAVAMGFAADAYPVVVTKAYVHVQPMPESKLHLWGVDNPDEDALPVETVVLDPDEGPFFEIAVNLSLTEPGQQLRVGVESAAFDGLSVPYRNNGSGLHLVKTCDSLIPEFGCLLDDPVWKPATAGINATGLFGEIHVEIETAGGAGYCE